MFVWLTMACSVQHSGDGLTATFAGPQDSRPPGPSRAPAAAAPGDPVSRANGDAPQTDSPPDTGAQDTGTAGQEEPPPVVALLNVDVVEGEYPLVVSFDTSGSDLGTGAVRYEWDFGDGVLASGDASRVHTYVGKGEFEVVVTLIDDGTGQESTAEVTIDVDTPDCPNEDAPIAWGVIDSGLDAVSGIAASRREPNLYWLEQDNDEDLVVVDSSGVTVSEHELPNDADEIEDIALAVDPNTGVSMVFAGDIGDNYLVRDHVVVWVAEEPDPWADSELVPLRIELTYPDGPHDAETLLVDPLTLDLFIVTKELDSGQSVYVKRAPHDVEGTFELDDLGFFPELDMTATGGDVSPDGYRIVVRDYSTHARMWFRDLYGPFEEAFDDDPCSIDIVDDEQGEGAAFTLDGGGIVTINEGAGVPIYYVELD